MLFKRDLSAAEHQQRVDAARARWEKAKAAGLGAVAGAAAGYIGADKWLATRRKARLEEVAGDAVTDTRARRLAFTWRSGQNAIIDRKRAVRESSIRSGYTKPAESEKKRQVLSPISRRIRQLRANLAGRGREADGLRAQLKELDDAWESGTAASGLSERDVRRRLSDLEVNMADELAELEGLRNSRPQRRTDVESATVTRQADAWESSRRTTPKAAGNQVQQEGPKLSANQVAKARTQLQALEASSERLWDEFRATDKEVRARQAKLRRGDPLTQAESDTLISELKGFVERRTEMQRQMSSQAEERNRLRAAVSQGGGRGKKGKRRRVAVAGEVGKTWERTGHRRRVPSSVPGEQMRHIRRQLREHADDVADKARLRANRMAPGQIPRLRAEFIHRVEGRIGQALPAKWRWAGMGAGAALGAGLGAAWARDKLGKSTPAAIEAAVAATAREPTPAQAKAGNYPKGKLHLHGLPISIETPAGAWRRGVGPGGKPWAAQMPGHYGYVRGTIGADGDQVDVTLGPGAHIRHLPVFAVDQIDPRTGAFDEHKFFIGWPTRVEALAAYDASFSDGSGPRRRKACTALTLGEFKAWLSGGDMAPLAKRARSPLAKASPAGFRTALGSVYRRLANGQTERLKMSPGKGQGQLHRASNALFVTPEVADEVLGAMRSGGKYRFVRIKGEKAEALNPGEDLVGLADHEVAIATFGRDGAFLNYHRAAGQPKVGMVPVEHAYEVTGGKTFSHRHVGNKIVETWDEAAHPRDAYGKFSLAKAANDTPDDPAPEEEDPRSAGERALEQAMADLLRRWSASPATAGNLEQASDAVAPAVRIMEDAAAGVVPDDLQMNSLTASGPRSRVLAVDFDSRNPRVRDSIDRFRLQLAGRISQDTREAVRRVLQQGAEQGLPVEVQARSIRDVVGLSPGQGAWVQNFRRELEQGQYAKAMARALRDRRYDRTLEKLQKSGEPLKQEQLEDMVAAYRRRTLAYRATSIARTEGIRAANFGQVAGMRSFLEQHPDLTVEKTWLATRDSHTREAHRALNGATVVGLDTPFTWDGPKGQETIRYPHDEEAAADQVIQCRCTLTFRVIRKPEAGRLIAEAV